MCRAGGRSSPPRHRGRSPNGRARTWWSARLADRAGLTQDLDEADDYDVHLTELKAAAVDVACERALSRGAEVVFVDNRVVAIEGQIDLDVALREVVEVVRQRGGARHSRAGSRAGEYEGIQDATHPHLRP